MKLKFVVGILLVMVAAMSLCACRDDSISLSNKERNTITSAFAQEHNIDEKDVSFTCYGKFNKTYVIIITSGYSIAAITHLTVDGVEYVFPDGKQFDVYHGGTFYTLQEAFDNGLVTHNNLVKLQMSHKFSDISLYNAYVGTITLTGKEQKEIVTAYATLHEIETKEFSIDCYGKFNNTYVMLSSLRVNDERVGYTVDGVDFAFNLGRQFDVYHNGNFYTLQEAFDEGLLTHDNLITLQTNYKKEYGFFFSIFGKDKQN